MQQETHSTSSGQAKQCQNCKQEFVIEHDDFSFYEKMKVPPPTWCPECRMQRRMTWRNERALYKRVCDLCRKEFIGVFHSRINLPVFCSTCWYSDELNAMQYGILYDESRSFLNQFIELREKVPRLGVIQQGMMVNSEFTNCASNNRDCYLIFASNFNERCAFSYLIQNSIDSLDNYGLNKSELCYECIDCFNSYKLFFSHDCTDCRESAFLFNCRNCINCFLSNNLVNKKYYIFNEPHQKEDYLREIKKISERAGIEGCRSLFEKMKKGAIVKYMTGTHNTNVSGDWLWECNNTSESFRCRSVEDGKYLYQITEAKDCMDFHSWGRRCELMYEVMTSGYQCSNLAFTNNCWDGNHSLRYCDSCRSSSNLFGCIGLHSKQYCILNKQYTKEEYENLIPKIIESMNAIPYIDAKGRVYKYGEFFPSELSLFAYNETFAQEYFPLSKDEALARGYSWRDQETKNYKITKKSIDLPSNIQSVDDSILNEIIQCEHNQTCAHQCTKAFKIIESELQFYKKINLPLPRLCPNCRHYERLAQRNPLKLWHRQCMCDKQHPHHTGRCPNEFETSYSPDRKEIVYCEQCYQQEVV